MSRTRVEGHNKTAKLQVSRGMGASVVTTGTTDNVGMQSNLTFGQQFGGRVGGEAIAWGGQLKSRNNRVRYFHQPFSTNLFYIHCHYDTG